MTPIEKLTLTALVPLLENLSDQTTSHEWFDENLEQIRFDIRKLLEEEETP